MDQVETGLFDWIGNPSWARHGGEHFDNNWVPDCGGKADYDPGLLRLSCRVYPDGDWIASVYLGEDEQIETTGIMHAADKASAKVQVEVWARAAALHYADAIRAARRLPAPPLSDV